MKTNPLDPTLRDLEPSGCCAGIEPQTPAAIENRPGLPAVSFRAGTHAQFKASLLAALTAKARPQLGKLRTREDDDLTIALLDGFATLADVLTFYSERIANEAFLGTATERRSVLELARAIGYEVNPGVAASTWLAFTVEDAPGSPGWSDIPARTRVQSIPAPGELPQTFETIEDIQAKKEWNQLKPLSREIVVPWLGQEKICLAGVTTNLRQGDALLIIGQEREKNANSENWDLRLVKAVENPDQSCTEVTLHRGLGKVRGERVTKPAQTNARVYALRSRANVFGFNAPDPRMLPENVQSTFNPDLDGTWKDFGIFTPGKDDTIDLDTVHSRIMRDDWVVISDGSREEVFRVEKVTEEARADFMLAGKTTRLQLSGEWDQLTKERVRETTVFCEMEELAWMAVPVERPVQGESITLESVVEGLEADRRLILQGRQARVQVREPGTGTTPSFHADSGATRPLAAAEILFVLEAPADWKHRNMVQRWRLCDVAGIEGEVFARINAFDALAAENDADLFTEFVTLSQAELDEAGERTVLQLTDSLKRAYDPVSVTISANVAAATHGETVEETVGHGDASKAHQQFALKQIPLTFTPAETATGSESSLEVFVNDVQWTEVDSLYGRGRRDRVFVARRENDGVTKLIFGDGWFGALLPTGHENIHARYRKGIGLEGNLNALQLTLLMNRPLGVKSVTNPAASSGAQDPEEIEDARSNAPLQTLTLGRVVSLQDYEDFSRAFSGIAKAYAVWIWSPRGRGVHVTVAMPDGVIPPSTDDTRTRLKSQLLATGDPFVAVTVELGVVTPFVLAGEVIVQSDRIPEVVAGQIQSALVAACNFDARRFGQNVALSEVVALIQNVAGVESVLLTQFDRADSAAAAETVRTMLEAARTPAGTPEDKAVPAEVIVLDETSLSALKVRLP